MQKLHQYIVLNVLKNVQCVWMHRKTEDVYFFEQLNNSKERITPLVLRRSSCHLSMFSLIQIVIHLLTHCKLICGHRDRFSKICTVQHICPVGKLVENKTFPQRYACLEEAYFSCISLSTYVNR